MIKDVFGFMWSQPWTQTVQQMRILHVSFFAVSLWLMVEIWIFLKEYSLLHPEAPWLTVAMPSYIASVMSGIGVVIAYVRKPHRNKEEGS